MNSETQKRIAMRHAHLRDSSRDALSSLLSEEGSYGRINYVRQLRWNDH